MKTKLFFTLLLIAGLVVLNTNLILAQPGTLDSTFGGDGIITSDIGFSDNGTSVAIQSNGKIVVAGFTTDFSDADFVVARYNSNGSPDLTFSGDGKVITDFGAGISAYGCSVAIQLDGKIVVAGYAKTSSNYDFAVARYNSNGTPDITFSGDGRVTTDFGTGRSDYGQSVKIQLDGKIVVAGYSNTVFGYGFSVARYNSIGTLDNTFGGDGTVVTLFEGNDFGRSVAIQSDGKIVVAGESGNGDVSDYDFAVARYTSTGVLDNTFSGDGKTTTNFGLADKAYSVAIQSNGKLVAAGYSNGYFGTIDFAVARYNSNGTLDNTFSGDGKVTASFGLEDYGRSVAIEFNGKIVVAGYSGSGSIHKFAVARLTSTGILDNTFSGDGKVTTDIDFGSIDYGQSVAIQANGRIVVAGSTGIPYPDLRSNIAVARYRGTPVRTSLQADSDELFALNKVNADASSAIHLYPNPVTDILHVKGLNESASTTISITDASGKLIQKVNAVNGNYTFNVKMFTPGIYYITIAENKKITNLKFIKQ